MTRRSAFGVGAATRRRRDRDACARSSRSRAADPRAAPRRGPGRTRRRVAPSRSPRSALDPSAASPLRRSGERFRQRGDRSAIAASAADSHSSAMCSPAAWTRRGARALRGREAAEARFVTAMTTESKPTTGSKRPGRAPAARPQPEHSSCEKHREDMLDEALKDSFPASDHPSIVVTPSGGC